MMIVLNDLRKAIAREQQLAQDGVFNTDDDVDEDDDSSPAPLLGEEDDPALTLAMNHVEDGVPLSSDTLENKGMMRKAAAAAHDAAAMLKSNRKRTGAWKDEVRLYSTCLACLVKMLRQFLQSVVRQSFVEDTLTTGKQGWHNFRARIATISSTVCRRKVVRGAGLVDSYQ